MSLDITYIRVQGGTSLAIDQNVKAHISYASYYGSYLGYTTNATGTWVHTRVDSSAEVGTYNAIALDANAKASISYYDATNGDLKYATNGSDLNLNFLPALYYLLF
jgi:hypothetical protein